MNKHNNHILIIGFLFFFMLSSCTPKSNNIQELEITEKKVVASEIIESEPKILDIKSDDTEIKILVIKDSVDAATTISVSTSEITYSNLSVVTNPITPLISIEVSQPLKKALKVQIPIKKRENEVVAAIEYRWNENVIDTLDSVFSDNDVVEVMIDASTDFFISSVAQDLVLAKLDTGFRPSVDGFQITNYSNYYASEGICSGMVKGSLYYFLHKKSTLGPLYNHYNEEASIPFETPTFSNDDFSAIALSSALQALEVPSTYSDYFFNTRLDSTAIHFYRMAYHIMISNKPQVVHLFDKPFTADYSNDPTVGHAVIVYKIDANHAYIYDPNHPGDETLRLELNTQSNTITPYIGALSADSNQTEFEYMYYYPLEHIINEAGIAAVFDKMDSNQALVTIPKYELMEVIKTNNTTTYASLASTHKTSKDTIEITLKNPTNGYVRIYDKNQTYVELINNNTVTLSLPEEDNYYGFEILLTESSNPTKGLYSDFRWINIQKVSYDPWTVLSTITSVNSDHYSQNEIDQMLNVTITTPLLVLYDEVNQQFDTFNPENNQHVVIKKNNTNVSYVTSYSVNNDTITNTFDGVLSEDNNTITGISKFVSATSGELYRMNVVMSKNK